VRVYPQRQYARPDPVFYDAHLRSQIQSGETLIVPGDVTYYDVRGVETDCNMVGGALGSGVAIPCPDNFCGGFINGQYFQFISGAGGAQGYVNPNAFSQGLDEVNGQFYTNAQYNAYMVATYPDQIDGQYGSVSSGLYALSGDSASAGFMLSVPRVDSTAIQIAR
jgi:hypothetical protein